MARIALPFPVLPGKTEEDLLVISRHFQAHPDEYAESRRRGGVSLERAYLQKTPMGMFVVAYLETSRSIAETLATPAQSDLDIDRFFVENVRELHGIDLTQPMPGPQPEVVGEWVDTAVTGHRRGMAFCAPMVPEMIDHAREWSAATFASEGMTESRRALGQNVEIVTLVHTPEGPVVAVYIEGDDPVEGNRRFAESTRPFDVAFKDELKRIFPPFVDFSQPVQGITEIFDSEAVLAAI